VSLSNPKFVWSVLNNVTNFGFGTLVSERSRRSPQGVEASWSRLPAGRSGIRRLPDDMVGNLPAEVGGVVPSLEDDPEAGFD